MNRTKATEEIMLIKEMIDKTKQTAVDYWNIYLCWGLVGLAGVAGMYVLALLQKFEWIWLNWIVVVVLGLFYTMVFSKKKEKQQGLKTYAHTSIRHLAIACGFAFLLVGFVFPLLELYSYGVIPVLISVVAGIYAFTKGGVLEWNLLKITGLVWWLGALCMVFLKQDHRTLLFVPLLVIGYFVPVWVVKAEAQKKQA
jgi:hypothetical protein